MTSNANLANRSESPTPQTQSPKDERSPTKSDRIRPSGPRDMPMPSTPKTPRSLPAQFEGPNTGTPDPASVPLPSSVPASVEKNKDANDVQSPKKVRDGGNSALPNKRLRQVGFDEGQEGDEDELQLVGCNVSGSRVVSNDAEKHLEGMHIDRFEEKRGGRKKKKEGVYGIE